MDSSHPLVPKRKLTASQVQRGKIYNRPDSNPQTVAAQIMRLPQHDDAALSPHLHHLPLSPLKLAGNEGSRKKPDSFAAIRIDPSLASMFDSEPSIVGPSKDTTMNWTDCQRARLNAFGSCNCGSAYSSCGDTECNMTVMNTTVFMLCFEIIKSLINKHRKSARAFMLHAWSWWKQRQLKHRCVILKIRNTYMPRSSQKIIHE